MYVVIVPEEVSAKDETRWKINKKFQEQEAFLWAIH